MKRSTAVYIGLRYLLSRKGNRFISFTSLISVLGITLGVFVLITVLSVYNGSQGIQRDRTLITVPHADIWANPGFSRWGEAMALVQAHPGVEAIAPYLVSEAMFSDRGLHQVAAIKGIDPAHEIAVSELSGTMVLGRMEQLTPGSRNILLGRGLAGRLRVGPGDDVNLLLPVVNASSQGFELNSQRFRVSGIFDVRFSVGSDLAYMHLEDAAAIMGLATPAEQQHLRLRTRDLHQAARVLSEVLTQLDSAFPDAAFKGIDWSRSEAGLFTALRMEKIMTGLMLMMIVAIGAFNIVATLVMLVSDKQMDIAILRTMGAGERTVLGIFLVQGALAGIAGTLTGAIAGVWLVQHFDLVSDTLNSLLDPSGLYLISSLPAELQQQDVVIVCLLSLLISFLATLYPAWRASGIQPAEVLRYE